MHQPALHFGQAPPILVPLRFFLTAPLFPILAALIIAAAGPESISSRWTPALLGATHFLTLGFLTLVMIGASLQLLPVVADAPVPHARHVSVLSHALLALGTAALGGGLVGQSALAIHAAMWLLGAGFAVFIGAVGISLARAPVTGPIVSAMRLALTALVATVLMGLGLGWLLTGRAGGAHVAVWVDTHLTWGLAGWVGLLVMGVAYQVVPMFQMTPAYPAPLRRVLAWVTFAALVVWSTATLRAGADPAWQRVAIVAAAVLAGCFTLFAVVTLVLQQRRRRRLPDVTLAFWRIGMLSLVTAAGAWLANAASPGLLVGRYQLLPVLLVILGFAVSVTNGMLYKIVPFLVWLHLQQRTRARGVAPNMKEIVPDRRARWQLGLHVIGVCLTLAAVSRPQWFLYPAMAVLACSSALLWFNLITAYRVYLRKMTIDVSA